MREGPKTGPRSRVVSLLASGTEIVCALDCGDRLVGRSHECDFPAWVRELPAVTVPRFDVGARSGEIDRSVRALVEQAASVYHVDAEALAALAPDVLVTQIQCEVCAVSRRDIEAAIATTVSSRPAIVSLEPNALADLLRDFMKVADALGVPERGIQLVSRTRRRGEGIARRLADVPKLRVACIEWLDPLMAAGNWTPELIAMAGGEDLFGTSGVHAPGLEWQALRDADPDVIWVTPCGFDLARTRDEMAALTSREGWSGLRAVRGAQVFLGDGNAYFNRPGPRVAETLEILAEAMHPDAFRFGHEGTGWERWNDG